MPEVTTKPFVYREGGTSCVVKKGTKAQELSAACAAHARSIGALENPAPAVAAVAPAEAEAASGEPPAEPETAGRKRK